MRAKDRIFISAILLSAAWHIFWLSAIKVIVAPSKTHPLKFSKVSFLGPILEMGAIEVRVAPREHSFLEKRYLMNIKGLSQVSQVQRIKDIGLAEDGGGKLTALVEGLLNGSKLEPQYSIE